MLFNEPETNGIIGNGGGEHSPSSEHSRTLRLSDSKKAITLIAPSTSECSLWVKRIMEARRQFAENEKSRLQRQRSSKYHYWLASPANFFKTLIIEALDYLANNAKSLVVKIICRRAFLGERV